MSGILDEDFWFGYIIEGYQYLTIEDVLSITDKNDVTYFDIENMGIIQKIFHEYVEFTKPLLEITEDKKGRKRV